MNQAPRFCSKVPSKGDISRIETLNSIGKITEGRQVLNYLPTQSDASRNYQHALGTPQEYDLP